MSRQSESAALHARARAMVAAFEAGAPSPESLDALACDMARYQGAHCEAHARLHAARGIDPAALIRASDVPAVPTDAFKLTRVATFPSSEASRVFRTSGTTAGDRGAHELADPETYARASVAFGKHWLARDVARLPILVVGPSPAATPDSSLGAMCGAFQSAFGSPASNEEVYVLDGGIFDLEVFDRRVAEATVRGEPVLVLGTSLALANLVEVLGESTFPLPAGSRVMQTGGGKGQAQAFDPEALRKTLAACFRLDVRRVVTEYGMTELGSQFYEATLFDPAARPQELVEPPWARVIPVDPETLEPVQDGREGVAKIVDAINVDSAVSVLTQDRVVRTPSGFRLLGRLAGAPPRGCSLATFEMFSGGDSGSRGA